MVETFSLHGMIQRAGNNASAWVTEYNTHGDERRMNFAQIVAEAQTLARGLTERGLAPQEVIGLKSKNCIDWLIWDIAAMISDVVLQVFPEESSANIDEILKKNRIRFIATDGGLPGQDIIQVSTTISLGINSATEAPMRVSLSDIHSKTYSSGTEGGLKGLLVSKRGTEALVEEYVQCFRISAADSTILFLPLSHYPQRLTAYAALWAGASIHITDADVAQEQSSRIAPTFLSAQASFFRQALHRDQIDKQEASSSILGGKLRFILTAMATAEMSTAYIDAGVSVYETYGVTELGMVSWNCPTASRNGTVGRPLGVGEVELATDGEILVNRSNPLCIGYFDGEDRYDLFQSGAFSTGDIGAIDADGYLKIVGRKKNLITTRSGRTLHLEELERRINEQTGVEFIGFAYDEDQDELLSYLVVSTGTAVHASDHVRRQVEESILATAGRRTTIRIVTGMTMPSVKNGLLTRSMKLDRKALLELLSGVAHG